MQIDGRRAAASRSPGEIGFQLDGKYERLEVFVYYQPETGLPPHAAVDCRPIVARASECRRVREALWDLVARDFRDRQSQIEMEMERRDGIWNEYAPTWERCLQRVLSRACPSSDWSWPARRSNSCEQTAPRPEMAAELEALEQRVDAGTPRIRLPSAGRDLFARAVDLRRRIIFSHPALDFDRLLLTKRPPPVLSAPGDNYYGHQQRHGAGVGHPRPLEDRPADERRCCWRASCRRAARCTRTCRSTASGSCLPTPITRRPATSGSSSSTRSTSTARACGRSPARDDDPLAGAGGRMTVLCEDYDPCYLPDGGFAFISTRNQGGVRCHNGGRYCPTYLLYRCDADGSNIRQLSFGEANEWDPTMMPDGRILWMRWDYINRPVIPTLGLWTIRPDGTAAGHYFGNYTPNPCRICQPRPIPGSHKIVATTAGHHTMHAGSLILIDRKIAEDGLEAITRLTPEATFPESEAHSPVSFGSPYPLSEDLFLAAFCPDPYPGVHGAVSAAQRLWDLPGRHAGRAGVDLSRSRDLLLRADARSAAADAAGAAVGGGRQRDASRRASSTFRTSIRARKTFPAARSSGSASTN